MFFWSCVREGVYDECLCVVVRCAHGSGDTTQIPQVFVNICMYICICIYVYVYIYIYIDIYIYIYVYPVAYSECLFHRYIYVYPVTSRLFRMSVPQSFYIHQLFRIPPGKHGSKSVVQSLYIHQSSSESTIQNFCSTVMLYIYQLSRIPKANIGQSLLHSHCIYINLAASPLFRMSVLQVFYIHLFFRIPTGKQCSKKRSILQSLYLYIYVCIYPYIYMYIYIYICIYIYVYM